MRPSVAAIDVKMSKAEKRIRNFFLSLLFHQKGKKRFELNLIDSIKLKISFVTIVSDELKAQKVLMSLPNFIHILKELTCLHVNEI